ncbi:MAG: multidrug ABC transporter ATP-binding protein, partial [Chlorobiaceae bacterium]|nr:multidrug ABC transporter ATP-binding protein [Chlorobiaceae bacterium]
MSRYQYNGHDNHKHIGIGNPVQPGRIEKPKNSAAAVQRLVRYLSPFRSKLIGVALLVVLYSLLGLTGPYLI